MLNPCIYKCFHVTPKFQLCASAITYEPHFEPNQSTMQWLTSEHRSIYLNYDILINKISLLKKKLTF